MKYFSDIYRGCTHTQTRMETLALCSFRLYPKSILTDA